MGEVIEINIVSYKKYFANDLMQFISLFVNDVVIKTTIEVMDNWRYENSFEITSEKEIEYYLNDKIICITETFSVGQAGVNIEHLNGNYAYCIWFNWKQILSDTEYMRFVHNAIKCICHDEQIENVLVCAIGKEVIFEYLNDIKSTISKSHNVDVWILDREECIDDIFGDYDVLEIEKYKVIIKSKL